MRHKQLLQKQLRQKQWRHNNDNSDENIGLDSEKVLDYKFSKRQTILLRENTLEGRLKLLQRKGKRKKNENVFFLIQNWFLLIWELIWVEAKPKKWPTLFHFFSRQLNINNDIICYNFGSFSFAEMDHEGISKSLEIWDFNLYLNIFILWRQTKIEKDNFRVENLIYFSSKLHISSLRTSLSRNYVINACQYSMY